MSKPRDSHFSTPRGNLFKQRLCDLVNHQHALVVLEKEIDWDRFINSFGELYSENGRPGVPTRIMLALVIIKFTFNISDEVVVKQFCENIYYQFFCGVQFLEHEPPCTPEAIVYWRKRIGSEKLKEIHVEILSIALRLKFLDPKDLRDVTIDTTVQPKNVTYPTDAGTAERMRIALIKQAKLEGIFVKQSYSRTGKKALYNFRKNTHAKHYKKANKNLKRLKTMLGRVRRDIERKLEKPSEKLGHLLHISKIVEDQKKHSKEKIYSVHEPFVECIGKGKAHKPWEYGVKVSVATTNKSNWVLSCVAMHGKPYDGHTLIPTLAEVKNAIGFNPHNTYADKGCRGHKIKPNTSMVYITGTKRKKSKEIGLKLKRRSAIEPVIGHLKSDHRMGRNFLKGISGDKINAVLAGVGKNMSKLLAMISCVEMLY